VTAVHNAHLSCFLFSTAKRALSILLTGIVTRASEKHHVGCTLVSLSVRKVKKTGSAPTGSIVRILCAGTTAQTSLFPSRIAKKKENERLWNDPGGGRLGR
jgi:hypothetical protein